MKKNPTILLLTLLVGTGFVFFTGCVPMKKFNETQQALASARYDSSRLAAKVADLETQLAQAKQVAAAQKQQMDSLGQVMEQQRIALEKQLGDLKGKNTDLMTETAAKNSMLSKNKQELLAQQE